MNQPPTDKLRIAVTGSNGYLGSRLCNFLRQKNHRVYELSSSPKPNANQVRFAFAEGVEAGFFEREQIDSLVHVAYDLKQISRADIWRVNVAGSIKLFEQAARENVKRIVFISTVSAFPGCKSLYGKAKLEIEKSLTDLNIGVSIRPGLIYSTPLADSGGIVGAMTAKLQKSDLMPLIGNGDYQLCLAHEQDLTGLIEFYARPETVLPRQKILPAANPRHYSFRSILENLARATKGANSKITFLPVPWRAVWAGIKAAETVGLKLGFRSDSVLGLIHQNQNPDFSVPLPDGIEFRDFAAAIRTHAAEQSLI